MKGGYNSPELESAKHRVGLEEIELRHSAWSRYAKNGALFSGLNIV